MAFCILKQWENEQKKMSTEKMLKQQKKTIVMNV